MEIIQFFSIKNNEKRCHFFWHLLLFQLLMNSCAFQKKIYRHSVLAQIFTIYNQRCKKGTFSWIFLFPLKVILNLLIPLIKTLNKQFLSLFSKKVSENLNDSEYLISNNIWLNLLIMNANSEDPKDWLLIKYISSAGILISWFNQLLVFLLMLVVIVYY